MAQKEAKEETERNKTAGESPVAHVLRAGGYSLAGLGAVWKHELAFRIEAVLTVVLLPVILWMPVDGLLKVLVIGSMLLVLMVELLNSSMEWVVDYISLERHPYAKRAKDMGSAAVMLALVNSGLFWGAALLTWAGWL